MFYTITHLKAPWPKGAVVGDVIELGEKLPAWAAGKAVPAGEGARATVDADDFVVGNGKIEGDGDGQALPTVEAINLELADLREKLAAAAQEKDYLQRQLDSASGAYDELAAEKEVALTDAADLREKLAAAEAAAVDAAANGSTTAKKR